MAALVRQPRAPRLGEGGLGPLERGTEPARRQPRRDDRAGDRPHPRPIFWHAAARLEDAADVAALCMAALILPTGATGLSAVSARRGRAFRRPIHRILDAEPGVAVERCAALTVARKPAGSRFAGILCAPRIGSLGLAGPRCNDGNCQHQDSEDRAHCRCLHALARDRL
jgi:hypothetical protein